jgi:hypothetical protein
MTEQEKNKLARLCGYSNERYTDKVKEGVNHSEYDKDRENAIMRKMMKAIFDKVSYGIDIPYDIMAEFLKYYEDIEIIKSEAKEGANL